MKTRIFSIPAESIVEFAEIIGDNELEGVIIGITDDEEVEIAVDYQPENSEAILRMIEYVDDLADNPDEDDDDY